MSRTPSEVPEIALSRHAHDRLGDRRVDDAWLAEAWAAPTTRVLPLAGARLATRASDSGREAAWVEPSAAPEGLRLLLGLQGEEARFAVLQGEDAADEAYVGLRDALGLLGADAEVVVHAVAMAEWHLATRFCPRCGGDLAPEQSGHVLRCRACDRSQFPRTDPAVIMIVSDGEGADERCLLGRNPAWPAGRYSTLAGFVEPGESFEQAVRREVAEETGIRVGEVAYFGSQPWPLPQSVMVGFTGRALSRDITVDGVEIEDARWFTREEMRREAEAGSLLLPGHVSISRSLIEHWYGAPLPGGW